MKKLLYSLCILLAIGLVSKPAQAQSSIDFGIRGGLNFANLNDTDLDTDSRTGFMVGVYANYLIPNSPVSIQPEVLYTQKGFEYGDATAKLGYIEIPVLAKFDWVMDGNITPHVYFGPYIGFNVSAEAEGPQGDVDVDIEDTVNTTDFGVIVGAGVDVNRFNVGVRYGAGLTEVADNIDGKNGVLSIVAGVSF